MVMVGNGLAKLSEELGELQQVVGKMLQFGDGAHPDGTDSLLKRFEEESADVFAAIAFVMELRGLGQPNQERMTAKISQYRAWHAETANSANAAPQRVSISESLMSDIRTGKRLPSDRFRPEDFLNDPSISSINDVEEAAKRAGWKYVGWCPTSSHQYSHHEPARALAMQGVKLQGSKHKTSISVLLNNGERDIWLSVQHNPQVLLAALESHLQNIQERLAATFGEGSENAKSDT